MEVSSEWDKNVYPKGVAGVSNIGEVLKKLEINCPFAVDIFDPIIVENNGIFTFKGTKTDDDPAMKVEAGQFLRVLMGYTSLDEIRPFVTILNQDGYDSIRQVLPKSKCYIIDEY
ncbi:MAG TPA: hypothetical protein DDW34_04135 [Clostridium sp.]|nr:hypothetical protein [Clostridium sp.]